MTATLNFRYDSIGSVALTFNGTWYYYLRNAQGDIDGVVDSSGNRVVGYTYDAWGKLLTTTGSMASTLGALNPLRYRGYVYDTESELYYLQSRYYNPDLCRFINADDVSMLGADGHIVSANLFAYCDNNPVNKADPTGCFSISGIIGAAIGGAIGGAVIGAVSYLISSAISGVTPSTAGMVSAVTTGAVNGAIGAVGGVVDAVKTVAVCTTTAISVITTAVNTEGSIKDKIIHGIISGAVTYVSVLDGYKFPVSDSNALCTGISSFSNTLFVGCLAETEAVAAHCVLGKIISAIP